MTSYRICLKQITFDKLCQINDASLSLSLSISLISFAKYVNENEGVFGRRQDIETCNTSSWVIITFERESERDKGEIKLDGIKSCYMFIPSILDRCFLTFPSQPLQCNDTLKTTT
jgi:hypothetical protein